MSDRVSNREDGIDLVQLVSPEAQLLSHSRYISIVEVCPIKIIDEIHKTTKCQDEEVKLLHKLAFAWRILIAPKVLNKAVAHVGGWRTATLATACNTHGIYVRAGVGVEDIPWVERVL